ncbi:MAG: tRNA (N(6)-L-threonylcarbamoyladenosine(37)-C(2))-methylthiotransferase MtaB [Pirellulales bacterium]
MLRTMTLGCKVNQYETQYAREGLLRIGYRDADGEQPADLCLVNTCTVTAEGDAKSRQAIRRLARRNPDARIVVMGCYATNSPDEVLRLPGVVEVIRDKRELPDWLRRAGVVDLPTGISSFGNRHRAYVKVQDGCLLRCSFCIIPHVRPSLASRPLSEIVEEVERLVDHGYREIVLTGIHLGHYGVDFCRGRPKSQWTRLSHLVERLAHLTGDFRLRLSSIEATEVTRELLDVMATNASRVAPHLHISMQSGSDSVLRRMRRRWGRRRFIDRCHLVRERLDHPALTTDVLIGFPGETDADFEETCRAAREVGFSKMHIFPFSPRRGTPAFEMPDRVSSQVRRDRCRHLASVERELRDIYFTSLVGRRLKVLAESTVADWPDRVLGTSCRYAPVEMPGQGRSLGELIDVTAGEVIGGRIQAGVE